MIKAHSIEWAFASVPVKARDARECLAEHRDSVCYFLILLLDGGEEYLRAFVVFGAQCFGDLAGVIRKVDESHVTRHALQGMSRTKCLVSITISHVVHQIVVTRIVSEHGDEFRNAIIRTEASDNARIIAASDLVEGLDYFA